MSSIRPDLPEGLELPDAESTPAAAGSMRRRNAASVTLRRAEADGTEAPSLDPATKSLADALRISYRLLQAAMVVLIGLYLLSGFQSVKESERAIRLTLGRVVARDLPSGFQFSLPAPFGELVKVETGVVTDEISKQFFPRLSDAEEKMLTDKEKGAAALAGGADSLDPEADGHLITADGNIAHARWTVTYIRAEAGKTASNISPEHERSIVIAAANRGVVQAAASLPIDDLLKKQVDTTQDQVGTSRVEEIARQVAQRALDEMESGIQITQLTMTTVIPPRHVMSSFQDVQGAQSEKGKKLEQAYTQVNDILTRAAGEAAPLLLQLIDRYEDELARGEQQAAASTLDTIHKVMLREPVEIEGLEQMPTVFGRVSQILDDARQYRSGVVNQAKADVAVFRAKRALFQSNPAVMINGDWTDAFGSFLSSEQVQAIYLPPTTTHHMLRINRDPAIDRAIRQAAQLKEAEEAQRKRMLERERQRFIERMDAESRTREG